VVLAISLCTLVGTGALSRPSPPGHVECLVGGIVLYAGGGSVAAYAALIIFGLPLFVLFRRLHWLRWWQVSLGGLLVGLLAASVVFAMDRAVNVYGLMFGGVGFVSGFLFWLMAVFRNRALTTACNRRPSAAADAGR